jgi:CRISPR/Cas system CSM-associated protein Csm2 small subunit
MSKINCSKNCKMTSQIRCSKFCKEEAYFEEEIKFSCQEEISKLNQANKNFYNCVYWDMDLKAKCNSCMLECPENKNPKLKERQDDVKRLDSVLNSINNFGVGAQKVYDIVDSHKKNKSLNSDVISALSFSDKVLSKAMSGAGIDISHFQLIAKEFIKKIKDRE